MKVQRVKLLIPRRWEDSKEVIEDFLARVDKRISKGIRFEFNSAFDVGLIFIENPEILSEAQLTLTQKAVEKVNRYVLELKNDPWTIPAIRAKTVAKMRKDLLSRKSLVLEA